MIQKFAMFEMIHIHVCTSYTERGGDRGAKRTEERDGTHREPADGTARGDAGGPNLNEPFRRKERGRETPKLGSRRVKARTPNTEVRAPRTHNTHKCHK